MSVGADNMDGDPQLGVEPQCRCLEIEEKCGALERRFAGTEARGGLSRKDMQIAFQQHGGFGVAD